MLASTQQFLWPSVPDMQVHDAYTAQSAWRVPLEHACHIPHAHVQRGIWRHLLPQNALMRSHQLAYLLCSLLRIAAGAALTL